MVIGDETMTHFCILKGHGENNYSCQVTTANVEIGAP